MDIGILGPGRLGRTLALLLRRSGHGVEVRGPGEDPPRTPVVLLTVPDDAIATVAGALAPGPVVLHCSGSHGVEVLRPHRPAGSLHPLMTFPGPEIAVPDLVGVPAAIAGDPQARSVASTLAVSLGMRPLDVPGDRRLYHAAAVMAGNFCTVLLAEAGRVLAEAGVPAEVAPGLLLPLAMQSLRNASAGPESALTGPVARGDHDVILAHRAALNAAGLHDVLQVYDLLSLRARELVPADATSNAVIDPKGRKGS